MTKTEKVKNIIKKYYDEAQCGCFFVHGMVGDYMENLYADDEVNVDICRGWMYFEIFGLNEAEQEEVLKYYDSL